MLKSGQNMKENIVDANFRLAEQIQEQGLVRKNLVLKLLGEANQSKSSLGQLLVKKGYLKASDLARLMRILSDSLCEDTMAQGIKLFNGVNFADYEIIEEIARGGMGIVYKAKRIGVDRIVALKILLSGPMSNSSQVKRFFREAKAIASLKHPNIIPIYKMGEENKHHYFTMKYIDGGTFQEIIEEDKFSLEQKLEIFVKVCKALQHAHQKGILHRDIKPSNILVDSHGEPYLTDFGLAKFIEGNSSLTQTGCGLGTPFYMSPEQVRAHHKKIDNKSDVYGLGVVLFQILTKSLPFIATNIADLYNKILTEEVANPKIHNPEISKAFQAICIKAIQKSPDLRYRNAASLARDVENAGKGGKVSALDMNWKLLVPRFLRLHRKLLTKSFALIVILIVLYVSFYWKEKEDENHPKNGIPKIDKAKEIKKLWTKSCELFTQYKNSEASDLLNKLLTYNPHHQKALLLQAQIYQRQKAWNKLRFVWVRLYEISEDVKILKDIGEKAFEKGFYPEAIKYFGKALNLNPKSLEIKKSLGKAFLYAKQYNKAFPYYVEWEKEKPEEETWLGLAFISYQNKKLSKSLSYIKKIRKSNDSYISTEANFLYSLIQWERLQPELNRYEWLNNHRKSYYYKHFRKKLKRIGRTLSSALEKTQFMTKKKCIVQALQKDIRLYIQAYKIERCSSKNLQEKSSIEKHKAFVSQLKKISLPIRKYLFFQNIAIRFLARSGRWKETFEGCNRIIADYPWVSSFYHMRLLSKLHLRKTSNWPEDISKICLLNRMNFIPISNLMHLYTNKASQREFFEYYRILLFYFYGVSTRKTSILILDFYLEKLKEKYFTNKLSHAANYDLKDYNIFLETALKSPSAAAREMAFANLRPYYHRRKFQEQLKKNKSLFGEKNANLKILLQDISKQKIYLERDKLRRVLLQYGVLQEKIYPLKVLDMGKRGRKILLQILESSEEEPMMRFLAARILLDLRDLELTNTLRRMAQGEDWEVNILVTAALSEQNQSIFKKLTKKKFFSRCQMKEIHPFYKVLMALYLSPYLYPKAFYSMLFKDKNAMVSIAAAYNCKMQKRLPSLLSYNEIMDRLLELTHNKDLDICNMAYTIFWDFRSIKIRRPKQEEQVYNLCLSHWKKYSYCLVSALDHPSHRIKLSIIQRVIGDSVLAKTIAQRSFEKDPRVDVINRKFLNLIEKSSFSLKFWAGCILGGFDNRGYAMQIVRRSKLTFEIRLGVLLGFFSQYQPRKKTKTKAGAVALATYMFSFTNQQPKSLSDRRLKQFMYFLLGWSKTLMLLQVRPIFLKSLEDTDENLKKAAIAALLWKGKKSTIKKLYPFLKSQNVDIQRNAATSIAGLLIKYAPEKIEKFNSTVKKYSSEIRRAAAYGYYCHILDNIPKGTYLDYVDLEKNYDLYTQNLEFFAQKSWILRLRNASELFPGTRYFYELALIHYKFKNYSKSLYWLREAKKSTNLKKDPTRDIAPNVGYWKYRCYILEARILYQKKQYNQAIAILDQAKIIYPLHPESYLHLSNIYKKLGEFSTAEKYYKKYDLCLKNTQINLIHR